MRTCQGKTGIFFLDKISKFDIVNALHRSNYRFNSTSALTYSWVTIIYHATNAFRTYILCYRMDTLSMSTDTKLTTRVELVLYAVKGYKEYLNWNLNFLLWRVKLYLFSVQTVFILLYRQFSEKAHSPFVTLWFQ